MQNGLKIWAIIGILVVGGIGAFWIHQNSSEPPTPPPQTETTQETNPPKDDNTSGAKTQTADIKKTDTKTADKSVYDVKDINDNMVGKTITLQGTVTDVKKPKNTTFFKIKDISSEKVLNGVLFNKTDNDNTDRKKLLEKSLSEGSIIYIDGEIDTYKNALEIKAWKVYTK